MKPANLLPKNIEIIQSLRGLSALAVVLAHFWHGQKGILIHPFLNYLSKAGAYGVHVFFIISGFILLYSLNKHAYKIKSFPKFLVKRLIRLEPAYIISILLVVLCSSYLAPMLDVPYHATHKSPSDIWLHLMYLIPFVKGTSWAQGVYWTLAVEFQFYLLIGLLAAFFIKGNISKYYKHLVLILCMSLGLIWTNNNFFPAWMTFFGIGMAAFFKVIEVFNWKDYGVQLLICLTINWIVFQNLNFFLLLSLFPILIILWLERKNMPFQFLGKISYSLYLIHGGLGLFLLKYCVKHFELTSVLSQMTALLVSIAFSIGISFLIYKLFEAPFTKLSKTISL